MELGHRVPLPTRGTSFRLRICCRSPAEPPLPPLPSYSISPPFTAERWGRVPDVLLWLALTHGPLASMHPRRLSVTFGLGPLPPSPTALSSDGSALQSERAADGRGGARVVSAPHVAYGSPRHNTHRLRPLLESLSCSSRARVSAAPPIRK